MNIDSGHQNNNILVDLDCLFDTRLPVLYALCEKTALKSIADDYYKRRVKDTFGVISEKIFTSYYKKRSKNVLKLALPTPMLDLVNEYCIESYTTAMMSKEPKVPTLYVNVYPYILNDEETSNLVYIFSESLPVDINIEIIYKSNFELTPKVIDNLVSVVIKYDTLEWLEAHNASGKLTKYPLVGLSCIAPMLANGRKPTRSMSQDDFDNTRAAFGPLTNIVFMQIRLFCNA